MLFRLPNKLFTGVNLEQDKRVLSS